MDEIYETKQKLENVRIDLQTGKIFSSLGKTVGLIIDSTRQNLPQTPVTLPDDNDGIVELIAELKNNTANLDSIEDDKLFMLLHHLGSSNPEIRDRGVLIIFNDLLQYKILNKQQLKKSLDFLISDEILFSHINEKQNDAVFLRSFAVMLLSSFIYIDQAGQGFIDPEQKNKLISQLAVYMMLENDTRGFDDQYGWIHTYTHLGNVLDELSSDDELIRADKILLMAILMQKFRRLKTPLIYGETSRIVVYLADQLAEDNVYQQFLLIELRNWKRALATTQIRESSAMWNGLFNRQRLFQAMLLNPNMAKSILEYLEDSNDFSL